jgi:hypothetical protein
MLDPINSLSRQYRPSSLVHPLDVSFDGPQQLRQLLSRQNRFGRHQLVTDVTLSQRMMGFRLLGPIHLILLPGLNGRML